MRGVQVLIQRAEGADPDIALPSYQTAGAAGADLRANLPASDRTAGIALAAGERALIPLGLHMALPPGYEAQIRPRSGMALKYGVSLLNTPGTIDADYRGPVGVIVINHGPASYTVNHGDRIAQMVIAPVVQAEFVAAETLGQTARGDGGFGSTGRV